MSKNTAEDVSRTSIVELMFQISNKEFLGMKIRFVLHRHRSTRDLELEAV